jgi:hypothetical protein
MNDNEQIIEMLREHCAPTSGLDARVVLAGAKRRRTRRRLAVGAAMVATMAVAATGVVTINGLTSSRAGQQLQVAGQGGPTAGPTAGPTTRHQIPQPARTTPPHRWKPGGPIGAHSIGTIPASGKVKVAEKYWFETKGTRWCATSWEDGNYNQPFGCRGTVGNTNLGDETAPSMQENGSKARGTIIINSVFRSSDAYRVIYTDNIHGTYYEGKVYRLQGIPGWTLAIGVLPWRGPKLDDSMRDAKGVFVYDKDGNLIFPKQDDGKPIPHPLQNN